MKIGIQLFGLLFGLEDDVMKILEKLPETGITEVEPCIASVPIPGLEKVIWPISWLQEKAEQIRAMGLEIHSVHFVAGDLDASAPELKELAEKVGIRQYVLKTPAEMDAESLRKTAESYRNFADLLAPLGVRLQLHNESADIRQKVCGTSAYEYLLDQCQGKVTAQVDVGWVKYAGEDVAAFLMRNDQRVQSLHYKDFPENATEPVDVPIGTGSVDMAWCLAYGAERGLPQYIDQEHFGEDRVADVRELVSGLARLR